jgi:hypothetical protein
MCSDLNSNVFSSPRVHMEESGVKREGGREAGREEAPAAGSPTIHYNTPFFFICVHSYILVQTFFLFCKKSEFDIILKC